jgi:nucleotide-binding universal stress UspA family protein
MRLHRIVAAVDGAECSGAVLALAVPLARQHGAALTGLFVVDAGWPDYIGNDWQSAAGARQGFLDYVHAEQEEQARAAQAQFAAATADFPGAAFQVVGADPADELIRQARSPEVDLLIASRRSFAVSGRPSLKTMAKRLGDKATRGVMILP